MTQLGDAVGMDAPLDTIEYLARSDHRIEVLRAIRAEPRTRGEIRDLADASRVTVGRIIADLEERGWVERIGRRYVVTTEGRYVATEFNRLVENLEAFDALPPVVEWFPDGEPAFDLNRLAGAEVVTAEEGDIIAPMRQALDLMEDADRVRAVASGAAREFVHATRAAVEAGARHTLVVPTGTLDALTSDPELRAGVVAGLEAGLRLLVVDADLPVIQIADDTVALCSGDHQAMVETDDEAVYAWAESYFESLLAAATEISPESIAADAVVPEGEAYVH
jgi:predicted transcriptional regulator